MVQLSALQRRALLATAAALLAVGLAPWPEAQHAAAPQQPRSKCPAGFSSGRGSGGELPAGHPPVASASTAYAEPPYATGSLTFDPPTPLPPPADAERALLDWMHGRGAEAEALLEQLVNIDSGTHNKAGVDAVATALQTHLAAAGVHVERRRHDAAGDHLLARVRCAGAGAADNSNDTSASAAFRGAPRVLMLGHMDTVFPDGTAAARPYSRRGGRAYGPGVSDMKAGLVAAALVLEAAQRHSCAGAGPLTLEALFTSDEEVGSVVSRYAISGASAGASAVFNMECGSPGGAVAAARKSSLTLRFEVLGAAAHAGNAPQEGASAVEAFARKVLRLHALNDYRVGVPGVKGVDGVTVSVGTVAGGSAPNVVPHRLEATVNARAWTTRRMGLLNATMRDIIEDETDLIGTRGRVLEEAAFPPLEQTPESAALLALYRRAAATLGDADVAADRRGGAADSAFASAAGAATLCAVGPLGDDAHADTEFLLLDSLVPRAQAVALVALRVGHAGGLAQPA